MIKSITFLTQAGTTLPSVRFRVIPYVQEWQKNGIQTQYFRIPKTVFKRIPFYISLPFSNIIIIQKKLLSKIELSILRTKTKKLCFDFDDAIWTNHPSVKVTPKILQKNIKNKHRLQTIAQKADLIICGNNYLKQAIKKDAQKILVLPTPIDTKKYHPIFQRQKSSKLIVGWIGTNTNLYFLKKILPFILNIKGIQLKIITNKITIALPDTIIYEKWNAKFEVEQICSLDIGLMPLTDDPYTQGKCGFKILQYMACGVVPIASSIGFNQEIISHGQNGFLVNKVSEWPYYIELLKNYQKRQKMALKARETVKKNFDLSVCSKKFLHTLNQL
ncbi:MAG: glycosyltransferase [Desulfonauticus sp.]|nr:glycosyltransferase [Desulfonauticus sp.]